MKANTLKNVMEQKKLEIKKEHSPEKQPTMKDVLATRGLIEEEKDKEPLNE